jgi:integrase
MKRPKTGHGRVVSLVGPLAADLEQLRPRVCDDDELVAPGRFGAPLDVDNWRMRVWNPAKKAAGVSAVVYDLRHSFVSLLLHEGRSAIYVADQVGHSSATLTLSQYAHLVPDPRHTPLRSMVDAITDARAELHGDCTVAPVRVLRQASAAAGTV